MIDIRYIQSMLARNKSEIRIAENMLRELDFIGSGLGSKSYWKKRVAKLAQIQIALKTEIANQSCRYLKPIKKHGKDDPRYQAFIESCKP